MLAICFPVLFHLPRGIELFSLPSFFFLTETLDSAFGCQELKKKQLSRSLSHSCRTSFYCLTQNLVSRCVVCRRLGFNEQAKEKRQQRQHLVSIMLVLLEIVCSDLLLIAAAATDQLS